MDDITSLSDLLLLVNNSKQEKPSIKLINFDPKLQMEKQLRDGKKNVTELFKKTTTASQN